MFTACIWLCLAAVVASADLQSPCPDLFTYDPQDQPGQWTGTITLFSEDQLHGIWARLLFDTRVTELEVGKNFGEVVPSANQQEFLVKNPQIVLKASNPTPVKITVRYEGDKVPKLTGYRLNAKNVCPPQITLTGEYFTGDLSSASFLSTFEPNARIPLAPNHELCGRSPLFGAQGRQNGRAEPGQWPWQAALYLKSNHNGENYVCGATLISSRHILTAAHCVSYKNTEIPVPAQHFTVYLSRNNVNTTQGQEQKVAVTRTVLYPGYVSGSLLNDLAILQLDKAVTIDDYVRPICLPKESAAKEGFLVGYEANAAGQYGDLAALRVELAADCQEIDGLAVDNLLCGKPQTDKSLCVGDSGSGLATLGQGPSPSWELRGIVNLGLFHRHIYQCNPSSTAVIVDLNNYSRWIRAVIS